MRTTIWKFEIPTKGLFTIEMPTKAEILSIQIDQKIKKPCIWALFCEENPRNEITKEIRYFETYGTGKAIGNNDEYERKYIGTYQMLEGTYIWHLFEVIK